MATPLSSSDQSQLQTVDNALEQYIKQAESGNVNKGALKSIQQQIQSLLSNPKIPAGVKQNLQAAAQQLKQAESDGGSIANLYGAKSQVDALLGFGAEPGEHGPGESSLGGG